MALKTGTHDVSSLFATRLSAIPNFNDQNMDKIIQLLSDELAAHNRVMEEMISDLADVTTERQRTYGSVAGGSMVQTDEYGRAPTQKEAPGETVGFPLHRFQYALGWTDTWWDIKKPVDLAVGVQGAQAAHRKRVAWDLKNALLQSGNYTFLDYLVDNVSLGTNGIKRLLNADSTTIPVGPNGETFTGSSHTHYVGEGSYTAAFLLVEITNVAEHGHTNDLRVYINRAQEVATRAFTGFVAYQESRVINQTAGLVAAPGRLLDISAPVDNRAIGVFGGAEVWVKPWIPADYVFVFDAGGPKPLVFRQREEGALQGLRVKATNRAFPLEAEFMVAEYGIAAWNRTNGSVLFITNATYADYAAAAP